MTVQGGEVPEFHIVPNMAKLQASGVTILDLTNAVQVSNIIDSPGLYQQDHQLVLGLVGAQAHDIEGLSQLTVKTTAGGAPVRIGDIASVVLQLPVYTAVSADGRPAVLLNITRQPSSNTVAVADAVEAQVVQLRAKLPRGVALAPYYDQSGIVRESVRSVRDAIVIGLALACIILFLFLRDWRASLIAGLVIPVTVAVTVLVLWITGESFNLMTLGGLAAAIGLVIDDAIVVVENIVLHREAGQGRVDAVRLALREIARPLVGSTITPVVVFLPLIAVSGVTGSFFPRAGRHHDDLAADVAGAGCHVHPGSRHRAAGSAGRWNAGHAFRRRACVSRSTAAPCHGLASPCTELVAGSSIVAGPGLPGAGVPVPLRISRAWLRPVARDGRRRFHPRLHHACGHVSPGID